MSKYSWLASCSFTTDADFRRWGTGVTTALAATGMVQAGDTGQIDWSTVATPASGGTYVGYEIWALDDALSATYPVYLKIEYGCNGSTNVPGLKFTVGKGSNGSGTITTKLVDQYTSGGIASTTPFLSMAVTCSGGSGVALTMGPGSGYYLPGFALERSLDADGNPTGQGLMFAYTTVNSSLGYQWTTRCYGDTNAYTLGFAPVTLPSSYGATTTSSPDGERGVILPIVLTCPGVAPWTSKLLIAIAAGDAALNSLFTATVYGTQHTYRGFPVSSLGGFTIPWSGVTNAGTPAAIIWE